MQILCQLNTCNKNMHLVEIINVCVYQISLLQKLICDIRYRTLADTIMHYINNIHIVALPIQSLSIYNDILDFKMAKVKII